MKYNVERSTDCKILRGENCTLEFKYTDIFEGGICLFVLSSSFHWPSSIFLDLFGPFCVQIHFMAVSSNESDYVHASGCCWHSVPGVSKHYIQYLNTRYKSVYSFGDILPLMF